MSVNVDAARAPDFAHPAVADPGVLSILSLERAGAFYKSVASLLCKEGAADFNLEEVRSCSDVSSSLLASQGSRQ